MGLLEGLLGARKLLLAILVPLLLLPLPMLHPSSEASCAYVLIVTAVYWVSEAVPLGAAALVPAFLYPFFGVLRSSEVAGEYFKNTTLLLVGVICVAAAVEKWNLHKRIALRMVLMAGAKPGMLLLCFMCCTTLLSMWLSNTSTTAMVMPIVEAVLQELVSAEEEQLVAGTSSAEEAEPISNPLTPVPSNPYHISRSTSNTDFSSLMQNKNLNGVPTVTSSAKTTNLPGREQHPSQVMERYLLTLFPPSSQGALFLQLQYPAAEVVNFGTWFLFSFPISLIMLVVSWFWMHWLFLGCNYPEMVTGFFFILMTVLWFTREPGFVPGWDSFFEKKGYRTDATVSVFLGFLLFLIPAKKPCFGKKRDGEDRGPSLGMEPIITWKDFQKTMPWEIVILVGGGYALASGSKTSGLSSWIGQQMLSLSSLPPWAVTLLACILVSIVTEFVSNPATITIFLPIVCSLSETLQINPLYTLIPVTMCISFAVMLPVGNPPNAIVFSYGHCQIKDMPARLSPSQWTCGDTLRTRVVTR
ncbi:SLC13A4 [Cervus elaphus hippelaphus]|uniref:SLC13A4 n=1 Tax=Cervus elaphus hippelaphus TaxID=46360 RepID=A0A212CKV6_CEREH|nr:SLC13A4 [Cervus elaphus hippelaphus]